MELTPISADLFFTKNDPQDPRLGEWALKSSEEQASFFIFGYPDDEGIKLNGGRLGASQAPKAIRDVFYRMTPDASAKVPFSLKDIGDVPVTGTLAERHEFGRKTVSKVLSKGAHWISLGGGHDYGYCDSTAFVEHYKDQKPLVINFDAHLDVRPSEKTFNSGTPFYRLMNEFGSVCNFIEVGLQPQCNSAAHTKWLIEKGGKIIWHEKIEEEGLMLALQQQVPLSTHPAFLSIDIDAFSSAVAPGCSQSWASGLEWRQFVEGFDFLVESFDVRGIGIYEVSPPLDQDNQTSKLAALIMHRYIFKTLKKRNL